MSTDAPGHRWRHDVRESYDPEGLADVFNRFSFGSDRGAHRRRRRTRSPAPSASPAGETEAPAGPWPASDSDMPPPEAPDDTDWQPADDEEPATSIRPYAWTGGRTKSNHRLELETLVSTSEGCQTARLQRLEHHSIAELCRHPRSVAEVGAFLGVPLGVAKVLLGDMADLGLITVHRTITENGSPSQLDLMERVLSGLRRL